VTERPIYDFPRRQPSEATPSLTPQELAIREFQPARWRRMQKEAGEREYAQSERGQKFIRELLEQHEDAVYERRRLEGIHGAELPPLPGELSDYQLAEITRMASYAAEEAGDPMIGLAGGEDWGSRERQDATQRDIAALEASGQRADLLTAAQRAVAALEDSEDA
jgi:hypothetical protein